MPLAEVTGNGGLLCLRIMKPRMFIAVLLGFICMNVNQFRLFGGSGRPTGTKNRAGLKPENTAIFTDLPQQCQPFHQAVEIGTSNFDTLIQEADPGDTGLSIDAMQVYIDQLPNMTCWRKLASAVVGRSEAFLQMDWHRLISSIIQTL